MQKTKREILNETSTLIEQIRTEINTGRCNGCMTCNKVSGLHDLLVQLLVLIKDDYPIECARLQKRTSRLVGCAKIGAYDFGGIVETFNEKLSNEPNVMGDEIVQAYLSNSPRLLEENGY